MGYIFKITIQLFLIDCFSCSFTINLIQFKLAESKGWSEGVNYYILQMYINDFNPNLYSKTFQMWLPSAPNLQPSTSPKKRSDKVAVVHFSIIVLAALCTRQSWNDSVLFYWLFYMHFECSCVFLSLLVWILLLSLPQKLSDSSGINSVSSNLT